MRKEKAMYILRMNEQAKWRSGVSVEEENEAVNMAIEALKEQIPHGGWGKWVISEVRCPECLEYFDTGCYSKEEMDKCPNCGADMRKEGGDS